MATKDKHPPLDPKRHSTNKRVKAKTTASVGAPVKTAAGAKKVKPGDGAKPAAKTVKAYDTMAAKEKRRKALNSAASRKLGRVMTPGNADSIRVWKSKTPTST